MDAAARYRADQEAIWARCEKIAAERFTGGYEPTFDSLRALCRRIGELTHARNEASGSVCGCISLAWRAKTNRPVFLGDCALEHSDRHRAQIQLQLHLARYVELREQYDRLREIEEGLGL